MHLLEARGWKLKPRYSSVTGIYLGMWWHDLSGTPRFHQDSFVCRVIEGKEDGKASQVCSK